MELRKENKCEKCRNVVSFFTLGVTSMIAIILVVFYSDAGAVLTHSESVMDKADVLFRVMWKTLCNGSIPILDPYDCNLLNSMS